MRRVATATAAAGIAVLVAGCSSGAGTEKGASGDGGASDTTAAAVQVARTYQSAVNGDDWTKACG
ncbi:hypothetical protein AB0I86_33185, partial [Streptomyces sp. NPDC049950]